MVSTNPKIALLRSPHKIAWCAQVQVAPEVKRITVFKKGTSHADSASIPLGGQTLPNSGVGFILE
jgi:hypothetical protein